MSHQRGLKVSRIFNGPSRAAGGAFASRGAFAPASDGRQDSNLLIALSLNLMLLAFFVVLSSATTFDTQRVAVAVAGIEESFALQPAPPAAKVEGPKSTAQASLREAVATAFAAVLPGYEIVVPPAADRIDVRVPVAALFDDGLFDLKSTLPVLDRLVGVLTAPPPGFRFEVILSATAGQDDPAITVVRADAVARGLVARGLLSDLISAGSATPVTTQLSAVIFTFLVLDAEDDMPVGRYVGTGGRS